MYQIKTDPTLSFVNISQGLLPKDSWVSNSDDPETNSQMEEPCAPFGTPLNNIEDDYELEDNDNRADYAEQWAEEKRRANEAELQVAEGKARVEQAEHQVADEKRRADEAEL
eukprot:Tbor_TRINITY_DN5347_c0_g1::TRINITY_DN5347_c0_g1_i15::g.4911::m.4911